MAPPTLRDITDLREDLKDHFLEDKAAIEKIYSELTPLIRLRWYVIGFGAATLILISALGLSAPYVVKGVVQEVLKDQDVATQKDLQDIEKRLTRLEGSRP